MADIEAQNQTSGEIDGNNNDRMTFQELVAEMKSYGKDCSAFDGQAPGASQMKEMIIALTEVHEEILSNMDASTKIRKAPMAWGNTSLSWKDVNFAVKDTAGAQRGILKDCNGHVPAGNLLALMGPSGCGKSTLLDILAQKKTSSYQGSVLCNGHDVKGDQMFRRYSTYVPQTDEMHEVLTVKETILFNSLMKNPPPRFIRMDPEVQAKIPDLIMSTLGLLQVKDTIIGGDKSGMRGVSGGQRRRVTLARGAVSGAQLLFADEPTSGLSATDAETCIKMLRFLSKRIGLTSVVVIHQPRVEVAELFDQLVLLTANPDQFGGSIVYNGPMSGTVDFCAQVGYAVPDRANPADWLMDMISPGYKHVLVKRGEKQVDQSVQDFINFYKANQAPGIEATINKISKAPGPLPREVVNMRWTRIKEMVAPELKESIAKDDRQNAKYGSPFMTQFAILFVTKLKLLKRDAKGLRMRMGMAVMQGLIVGIAFQDIASKIELTHLQFLFMAMQLASMSGMQVMPGLVDLRSVMKKDVDEGLHSISAWILGNCIIDAFLTIFSSSIFVLIIFAFSGISWANFGVFYFWVLLCLVVMDSYFNLIAATAPNGQLSTVMAMPCMIMFILFNGFLVSKESAPSFMQWALFVSPFYYSITSLANALYGADNCQTMGCKLVISTYGFDEGPSMNVSLIVLITMTVVFRVLQVIALTKLNKAQK